ncbi:TPA: hypothetical protein I7245_08130 [Vibrio vulnificus]|nr:hypothetical protein [Vibrio vulnificus]HDY7582663.1 hypothetical protein [Vibrio vulnificus]
MKKVLLLLVTLSLLPYGTFDGNYEVIDYESKYVGDVVKMKRPMGYLSGLGVCNDLPKYVAINSRCRFLYNTEYVLIELTNACAGCLVKERLVAPYRVHFEKDVALKVIDSFMIRVDDFFYKLFSSPLEMLVLEDDTGRQLEMLEIMYETVVVRSEPSREDELIFLDYKRYHEQKNIFTKRFCFTDGVSSPEKMMTNAYKLVNNFELTETIKIYTRSGCDKNQNRKHGFKMEANNFNDYITFRYYLASWGVYGKWYDY